MCNPKWNPNEEDIDKTALLLYGAVGMLGKLKVRNDGSCEVNGFCKPNDDGIATSSNSGYRVIKRVSENIVQVLLK